MVKEVRREPALKFYREKHGPGMAISPGITYFVPGPRMMQFYLLSVLANLVAGITLGGDYLGEKIPFLRPFKDIRGRRGEQVAIGVSALVIGIIKLFVLSPGEHIIILGDLLPAVTGIVIGGILLAEINQGKVEKAGEPIRKLSRTALTYRVPLGIAGIVVAFLHFLFPTMMIF